MKINDIKAIQPVPSAPRASTGQIIRGQVSQLLGDSRAVIHVNGKPLTVSLEGVQLFENQWITLKTEGMRDGAILARLIQDGGPDSRSDQISAALDRLNVSATPLERAMVSALLDADLPVTAENLRQLRQGALEIKTVLAQGEVVGWQADSDPSILDVPIRRIAIALLQGSHILDAEGLEASGSNVQIPEGLKSGLSGAVASVVTEALGEAATQPSAASESGAHLKAALHAELPSGRESGAVSPQPEASADHHGNIEKPLSSPSPQGAEMASARTEELIGKLSGNATGQSPGTPMELRVLMDVLNKSFGNEAPLRELLSASDFDIQTLLMKNQLPLTPKNLLLAHVFSGREAIEQSVEALTSKYPLPKSALLPLMEALRQPDAPVDKLLRVFEGMREAGVSESALERSVVLLKASMQFSQSPYPQFVPYTLPVPYEREGYKPVTLYYKKHKNRFNPDDMTVLLSLSTHHCGEVRCIVHKQQAQYRLQFSFENEVYKERFEKERMQLEKALESFSIAVDFGVKLPGASPGAYAPVDVPMGFDYRV